MSDEGRLDKDESDEELVARAQRALPGDYRAFEALVLQHQGRVLANCRYITGSPEDAQDLAQEIFVKVYFALSRFEGRSQFRSWLHRVKTNHCLNFVRKSRGKTFLAEDAPALQVDPAMQVAATAERDALARSQRGRVRDILDAMPETLRVPLVLRDLDELSYAEVAEILSLGLSATKMRIKRAREDFRRRFEAAEAAAAELAEGAIQHER